MKKNLEYPLYELTLDDALGVYAVALVRRPAMQQSWQVFSEDEKPLKFAVQDEEQRKVLAVLCRADFPIYRVGPSGYEYYVYFSRETVDALVRRLFQNSFQNEINNEHENAFRIDGVHLNQVYLKDSTKGINPVGFENIEEGSAFAEYKIEDDEVWQAIKEGVWTGVSIEGYFNQREVVPEEEMTLEDLLAQTE